MTFAGKLDGHELLAGQDGGTPLCQLGNDVRGIPNEDGDCASEVSVEVVVSGVKRLGDGSFIGVCACWSSFVVLTFVGVVGAAFVACCGTSLDAGFAEG